MAGEHPPRGHKGGSAKAERVPNFASKNFYERLGVSEIATRDEIIAAYRKLAHEHHPDKNTDNTNVDKVGKIGDDVVFRLITEANNTLKNPKLRDAYEAQAEKENGLKGDPNRAFLRRERERKESERKFAEREKKERMRASKEADDAKVAKKAAENGRQMGDEKGVPPPPEEETAMAAAFRKATEEARAREKAERDAAEEAAENPEGVFTGHDHDLGPKTPGDIHAEMKDDLARAVRAMEEMTRKDRAESGIQAQEEPEPEPELTPEPPPEEPKKKAEEPKAKEAPKAESPPEPEPSPEVAEEASKPRKTPEELAFELAKKADVGGEREAMLEAEREFIDARRAKKPDKAKVAELEEKYNAKSAVYENKLHEKLISRIGGRADAMLDRAQKRWATLAPEKRPRWNDGKEMTFDEYFEEKGHDLVGRYHRLVASRDILDRGAKRIDEAMASKERGPVAKGFREFTAWAGRQNAAFEGKLVNSLGEKRGKQAARAARIFGSATIGAGVASTLGAGVAAFGLGALGFRLARGAFGSIAGSAVGGAAGKLYEKTFGADAAESLYAARIKKGDTAEKIREKRKAYEKGNKGRIERNRSRVEMGGAFAVGGFMSGMMELGAIHDAAQTLAQHPDVLNPSAPGVAEHVPPAAAPSPESVAPAPEAAAPTPEQVVPQSGAQAPADIGATDAPQVSAEGTPVPPVAESAPPSGASPAPESATPEAVQPAVTPDSTPAPEAGAAPGVTPERPSVTVEINEKGEGAIKLFGHLREELEKQGYTADTVAPDSDAHYILTHTPDQSALQYKFWTADGSREMHFGDKFTLDGHGNFASQVSSEKFIPPHVDAAPAEAVAQDTAAQPETATTDASADAQAAYPSAEDIAGGPEAPDTVAPDVTAGDVYTPEASVAADSAIADAGGGAGPEAPAATGPIYGESPEAYLNDNKILVDPTQPALFVDKDKVITVFGGEYEARSAAAYQYLVDHPGSHVHIMVEDHGEKFVADYSIDKDTGIQQVLPIDQPSSRGGVFAFFNDLFKERAKLDANTFVRKL